MAAHQAKKQHNNQSAEHLKIMGKVEGGSQARFNWIRNNTYIVGINCRILHPRFFNPLLLQININRFVPGITFLFSIITEILGSLLLFDEVVEVCHGTRVCPVSAHPG